MSVLSLKRRTVIKVNTLPSTPPSDLLQGFQSPRPLPCSPVDLDKRRAANQLLCDTARKFFTGLPVSLGSAVLVLDCDGVVLEVIWFQPYDVMNERHIYAGLILSSVADSRFATSQYCPGIADEIVIEELEGHWQSITIDIESTFGHASLVLLSQDNEQNASLKSHFSLAAYAISQILEAENHLCENEGLGLVDDSMVDQADIHTKNDKSSGHQVNAKLLEYEKISSLVTLSAGIAHEIRNPLTTARGFLQLFQQRCETTDQAYLALTIHELDRIQDLLQDFMGLIRPHDEDVEFLDANLLLQSVFQFLRPEAILRDVELSLEIPDVPTCVSIQPSRMKQVLINLLQNAVHACKRSKGRVRIQLSSTAYDATITISDNGCGIADMEHLFHPFHTTKENGTGLGMFISKQIIEEHHGTIRVESEPQVGTTVLITLPTKRQ